MVSLVCLIMWRKLELQGPISITISVKTCSILLALYILTVTLVSVCYELAAGTCKLAHSIDNINGLYLSMLTA